MMKPRIFTISMMLLISIVMLTPIIVSAISSSYSYNAVYIVDGKANGIYHTLNKGTATIDGHAFYNCSKENWADGITPPGETVTYCLYREKTGFDTSYGCVNHYVSKNNDKSNVSKIKESFPSKLDSDSSKYYLVIVKSNNGWKIVGSGKLSTP